MPILDKTIHFYFRNKKFENALKENGYDFQWEESQGRYRKKFVDINQLNLVALFPDAEGFNVECICDNEDCQKHFHQRPKRLTQYHDSEILCDDCRRKKTTLQKFNVEYASQNEEVKQKMLESLEQTLLERYQCKNPMQINEAKNKAAITKYVNQTTKTSLNQNRLHALLGGELNYPIKCYSCDLAFLDERIILEYDGPGHFFYKYDSDKELQRENIIKSEGWKIIRFISKQDILPNDDIIKQIFNNCKEMLKTTDEVKVIFDVDITITKGD